MQPFYRIDKTTCVPRQQTGSCSLWPFQCTFKIPLLYQCFDAVGWVAGRAPGLKTLSGGLLAWLSVRGEVQICIWPSWCRCHSLPLAPVNPDWFYRLVLAHPASPRQRAIKWVLLYYTRTVQVCCNNVLLPTGCCKQQELSAISVFGLGKRH